MNSDDHAPPKVGRIARLTLNVGDLDPAVGFYVGALGFTVTRLTERAAKLSLGADQLVLVRQPDGKTYPTPRQANDPWFQHFAVAVDDMDAAYGRLSRYAPERITRGGPQLLPPSTGSVTAYKFRDPDGHPLELSYIPGGKRARATQKSAGATLGIDHTALAVSNLPESIAFYTGIGLRVAARLLNHGPEQGRLDGLDDPVVDIVALQTPELGPHIELLHYRSPAPPRALHQVPEDIAATVTVLTASVGASRTLTDPDGHRLQLIGSAEADRDPLTR